MYVLLFETLVSRMIKIVNIFSPVGCGSNVKSLIVST